MKVLRYIIFGIIAFTTLWLNAQEVNVKIEQSGVDVSALDTLDEDSPLEISCIDAPAESVIEISVYCESGWKTLASYPASIGSVIFNPADYTKEVGNVNLWADAEQFMLNDERDVAFLVRIQCRNAGSEIYSKVFNWILLPAQPKAKVLKYEYDYNFDFNYMENSEITIEVESQRANHILIIYDDRQSFDYPRMFMFTDPQLNCGSHIVWTEYYFDWGAYFRFDCINKYGGIVGKDYLCTTDYIDDPQLLKRIEELRNDYIMSVDDCGTDNPFKIESDRITFHTTPSSVEIFDIAGLRVLSETQSHTVYTGNLPKGIYVVRATFENGKSIVKKIIRR